MSTSSNLEEARARIGPVLERARRDPEYAQQLRQNPERVLREAGIPDDWIANVAGEVSHQGPATAESVRAEMWCTVWSCIFTAWWE